MVYLAVDPECQEVPAAWGYLDADQQQDGVVPAFPSVVQRSERVVVREQHDVGAAAACGLHDLSYRRGAAE